MENKYFFYIICCIIIVYFNFPVTKNLLKHKKQMFVVSILFILGFAFSIILEREDLLCITFGLTLIIFKRTMGQVARRRFAWRQFKRFKRKKQFRLSWKEPEPVKNSFHEILCLIIGIIFIISGSIALLRRQL
jgi:hypothetical protein